VREFGRLYRFIDDEWVQRHARPGNEFPASFNPILRAPEEGGRFDAADRAPEHWLYDPYSYAYGAGSFRSAYFEIFGERTRTANILKGPPELDATRWLELLRTDGPVEVVDVATAWSGSILPIHINTSPDYPACREWASWLRVRRPTVEAVTYLAPKSVRRCVVFFGSHPLATPGSGLPGETGCEGKILVREAYRITDPKVRKLMRGVGIRNPAFVW
jgi:hypothetical protein